VRFGGLPARLKEYCNLFLHTQGGEELREGDTVGFGSFADGLAAGNRTPDTAHAELKQGFGGLGLCLEEFVDGAVSSDLSHSITKSVFRSDKSLHSGQRALGIRCDPGPAIPETKQHFHYTW